MSEQKVQITRGDGSKREVESPLIGKLFAVTPDVTFGNGWIVTHLKTGFGAIPGGRGIGLQGAKRICRAYEAKRPKFTSRRGDKSRGQNLSEFLRVAGKVAPKGMVQRAAEKLKTMRREAR